MGTASLIVVSNRGPLTVTEDDDGEDRISRGGGGLVSGMQAALGSAADALWICAALNDRERALARQANGRLSQVESVAEALRGEFDVRMLPIDGPTFRAAYNGIANSTLWFVLHQLFDLPTEPVFGSAWRRRWAAYVRYNQQFAQAVADEAADGGAVMVQDYHLFLAPRMIRELRPDVRIGFFTHTPWVPADYFTTLPDDVGRDLVDGVLGADLVGFHTERWAELFRGCAEQVTGERPDSIAVFPLGTDRDEMRRLGSRRVVDDALAALEETVGDRQVIARVDRTELSKNVWRGLLSYRELLRKYPRWQGHVVHVVYDNPSREDLPAYREYTAAIERLAAEIDDEFSTGEWTSIVFEIVEDYPAALASLRRADVVFVNSVRDGMNLVVLEALVLSELSGRDPALVISREMGAAEVLGDDAIAINPFDVAAGAEALNTALLLDADERSRRATSMRAAAVRLPPAKWFQAQLDALPAQA